MFDRQVQFASSQRVSMEMAAFTWLIKKGECTHGQILQTLHGGHQNSYLNMCASTMLHLTTVNQALFSLW